MTKMMRTSWRLLLNQIGSDAGQSPNQPSMDFEKAKVRFDLQLGSNPQLNEGNQSHDTIHKKTS